MIDRRSFVGTAAAAVLFPAFPAVAQRCSGQGRFVGDLEWRALPDGRLMQLLKPYSYVDSCGLLWHVPEGAKVDGASIPQFAWSIIGGPFAGAYRNASVIHDWFCDTRSRPWRATHSMFLEGMLTSGVAALKAKIMYAAVMIGGPKWSVPDPFSAMMTQRLDVGAEAYERVEEPTAAPPAPAPPAETGMPISEEEFLALAERIEREDLSVAAIDAIAAEIRD